MPLVLPTILIIVQLRGTVFWSHPLMGDKLGGATGTDRLLASSGLSTPNSTRSWTTIFGAVVRISCQKVGEKVVLSVLGLFGLVWCLVVWYVPIVPSASNFQILFCSSRDTALTTVIRFLACPARSLGHVLHLVYPRAWYSHWNTWYTRYQVHNRIVHGAILNTNTVYQHCCTSIYGTWYLVRVRSR